MQIVLMRHGKPNISSQGIIRASQLKDWIHRYNGSTACPTLQPPPEACDIANISELVVCSDLARSITSAPMLGIEKIHHREAMFRETHLPAADNLTLKLPLKLWLGIFRLLWLFGFTANGESFQEAKLRASICAERLISLAKQAGKILFIGHGLLNQFIAKELRVRGWRGPHIPGKSYWEYGIYTYKPL